MLGFTGFMEPVWQALKGGREVGIWLRQNAGDCEKWGKRGTSRVSLALSLVLLFPFPFPFFYECHESILVLKPIRYKMFATK